MSTAATAPKRLSRTKVLLVGLALLVVIMIGKSIGGSSGSSHTGGTTSSGGGTSQTVDQRPLDQSDWNDICAGGGCNPGDGLPNPVDGGGLALTNP